MRNLGHPVDDLVDLLAELFPQFVGRHEGVFQHVVEQPGRDGDDIQLDFSQDVGDLERVRQVGLAVHAHLPLVVLGGNHVPALDLFYRRVGMVAQNPLCEVLITDHGVFSYNSQL